MTKDTVFGSGRIWIAVAGLSGLAAVALGAYGAHGMEADDVVLGQFDTANRYHMWHSLSLLGAGLLIDRLRGWRRRLAQGAALAFVLGILMFSGALYVATALGVYEWTFLAPWGGVAFMAGWGMLTLAVLVRTGD